MKNIFALIILVTLCTAFTLEATPLHAVSSARRCDTCHIEPSGWQNPDEKNRKCSLHCTSCHQSPSGGGLRTPAGRYFGQHTLPTFFSERVEHKKVSEKYRPQGHPDEGVYAPGKGFSGWWPGDLPMSALPDRFGDANADPTFLVGLDARWMTIVPLQQENGFASFPMQLDLSAALRLWNIVSLSTTIGYQGSKLNASRNLEDTLAIRDLYLMVNRLPYGIYARAGRFQLPLQTRMPDHTQFVRAALFGNRPELSQAFAIETGFEANYLFARATMFAQGLVDGPFSDGQRSHGLLFSAGIRDLGYALSFQALHQNRLSQDAVDSSTLSIEFAANLSPFTYQGQLAYRLNETPTPIFEDEFIEQGLFANHMLQWQAYNGVRPFGLYEYDDQHLSLKDNHRHRVTLGVLLDPIRHLQFDLRYRQTYLARRFAAHEFLAMAHVWF